MPVGYADGEGVADLILPMAAKADAENKYNKNEPIIIFTVLPFEYH
jgi:hypothetical protein